MVYFYLPDIFVAIPRNPVLAVGLPLGLGILGASQTSKSASGLWYRSLYQPPLAPPSGLYGTVWPMMYLAMGWASHLGVKAFDAAITPSATENAYDGINLYYTQLLLNLAWSPIFFRAKEPFLALIDSAALFAVSLKMASKLHKATDGASTVFLAPYCAWVGYATYINAGVWWINRNRTINKRD